MSRQGVFNPAGYIAGNPATYPQPAAGTVYAPDMWWDVSPAGLFDGTAVAPGDRIYVFQIARDYGDLAYGSQRYGDAPTGWVADLVTFAPWISNLPPQLGNPPPYTGCPLGDDHPGWHLIVDAFYNGDAGSRTYGADTYGADVYGDAAGAGVEQWHDVTHPAYSIIVERGTIDGGWAVDVDRITIDVADPDGSLFDMAQPASWYRPQPGDQIRVGVFDPNWVYYPLACGEIERIVDDHDTPPRLLSIEAFGFQMDLVHTIKGWRRNSELIQTRVPALLSAAGYRWGATPDMPATTGPWLTAYPEAFDVNARDELDRVAISAGWSADCDRRGQLRIRQWPLEATGTPIDVADCPGDNGAPTDAYTSPRLDLLADYDAMLNVAEMTNVWGTYREAIDYASAGQHGARSENFGFPLYGLYAYADDMQPIADRIVDELGAVVVHVSGFEIDTWVDNRWLGVVVDLDTGAAATVWRAGLPNLLRLDAAVVGYQLRLTPNRIRASVYTRTTTPTTRGGP